MEGRNRESVDRIYYSPNYGRINPYENRSHLLNKGGNPIVRNMGKLKKPHTYGAIGSDEEMIYTGTIPSIVGLVATIVHVNQREAMVYTRKDILERIRVKYGQKFKKVLGVVKTDPYEKTKHLRRRFYDDLEQEYDESVNFLEMAGYDPAEEFAIGQMVAKSKRFEELEDEYDVSAAVDIDAIKRGINSLVRKELEFFLLWIMNYSDSEIARNQGLKYESVPTYKGRIFRKLRDFYKVETLRHFSGRIVALNKVHPLEDFIESRLYPHGQTDNIFDVLTEQEREVFHHWKTFDETAKIMAVTNFARARVDACKRSIFDKLGARFGASSKDEFHEKIRVSGTLTARTENPDLDIESMLDIGEIMPALRSLADREIEIFECMCYDMSVKQIFDKTCLETQRIHSLKRKILVKVGSSFKTGDLNVFESRLVKMRNRIAEELARQRSNSVDLTQVRSLITDREWKFLTLWREHHSIRAIAQDMGIGWRQVDQMRQSIVEKTKDLHSATSVQEFEDLAIIKINLDLVDPPADHPVHVSPVMEDKGSDESRVNQVFSQHHPEIISTKFGPLENWHLQQIEQEKAEKISDLGPVNGPEVNQLLTVRLEPTEADTQKRTAVSFNQFIDAYGNRKDAVKALNEFNKLNFLDKQKAFEFIPKYKESLTNITFQQSPYSYLTGRSWK